MTTITRITVQDVTRHFEGLEDPRAQINRRHPLVSVVVIALMAVLAGAGGPTAIAAWANDKNDFLRNLVPLPRRIVLRRNQCLRSTEKRCGVAMIAAEAWVRCIRSASGQANSV